MILFQSFRLMFFVNYRSMYASIVGMIDELISKIFPIFIFLTGWYPLHSDKFKGGGICYNTLGVRKKIWKMLKF